MGEIMNSPKGVKSGVVETCDTRHDLPKLTGCVVHKSTIMLISINLTMTSTMHIFPVTSISRFVIIGLHLTKL